MKGSEFIRKVEKAGKANGVIVRFVSRRGKGAHGTLFYGGKFTIVSSLKKELKSGTFHAMLSQLGLRESDLR